MYKERKETTHRKIGEEQHTSSSIWKISTTYVNKCGHKTNIQEVNVSKRKKRYIKTSLYIPQSV